MTTIQAGADQKNPRYTYYLNPYQVVQKNLPFYGFTGGFQITSPASPSPSPTPYTTADGRPAAQFYVNYRNHAFTIRCVQPGKTGPTGIWMIVTILPGKQPPA